MMATHGRNASRIRSVTLVDAIAPVDDAIAALSAIFDHNSHLFMRFISYSIIDEFRILMDFLLYTSGAAKSVALPPACLLCVITS